MLVQIQFFLQQRLHIYKLAVFFVAEVIWEAWWVG